MKNSFATPIILPSEQARLNALRRYKIIGNPDEKKFVNIAQMVAEIFEVPIAMISLVDETEVYSRSIVGLEPQVSERGQSFCALTVLKPEVNVIENAIEDEIVKNNPFVCGKFGLRFYAGAPLITYDGFLIGTVCLVDTQPRTFSKKDRNILAGFANLVMEQIELRLANINEMEKQIAVNQQLTEANAKLVASEHWFQNILDTMAEGVCIVDNTGKLTYSNIMAQKIVGLGADQMTGRQYDDSNWKVYKLDGSVLSKEDHPITKVLRTGRPIIDQEIAIGGDGTNPSYLTINAAPIFDDSGIITGGVATFMDVTKRRVVLHQKDEFINVASHELKTPLTSLQSAIEIIAEMKSEVDKEVLGQMINQSNKSMARLTRLIDDLLNASRISQGRLNLRKSVFGLDKLIDECCLHLRLSGKHTIIRQGLTGIELLADEQQVEHVLVNLFGNISKYAPLSEDIYIIVEQVPDCVKITVRDHGPGISPEQLPHIFDRYFRIDYSGFKYSGLGLGLYISSEIIKKHGGTMGVNSEVGKGSDFWFTLPLERDIVLPALQESAKTDL